VCPKGNFEEWHKVNCLMGECVECGVGRLSICPNECFVNGSWVVAWNISSKILGWQMKGDPRIGLKKHSRELQLLCSYINYL